MFELLFRCSLVVADGVGQWSDWKIDAGECSQSLCLGIADCHKSDPTESDPDVFIAAALLRLRHDVRQKNLFLGFSGSSTLCIVTIHRRRMHVANIGDSGFMHLRKSSAHDKYKIILQSTRTCVCGLTQMLGHTWTFSFCIFLQLVDILRAKLHIRFRRHQIWTLIFFHIVNCIMQKYLTTISLF